MEIKDGIVILHTIRQFEQFQSIYQNLSQNNTLKIIAFTLEIRLFLESKKIEFFLQEDYMNKDLLKEMEYIAYELSNKWHNDLFKFKGISLGLLIQYNYHIYLSRIIRNIQNVLNIIEIENPKEIITFFDSNEYIVEFNDALKYICSLKKVPLNLISKDQLKLSKTKNQKNFFKKIQRFLQLYIYKYIFRNLLFFKNCLHRKKENILIFQPRYHRSLIYECSKYFNVFLSSNQIKKNELLQDFKNIFYKKREGFYLFTGLFFNIRIRKKAELYFNILLNKWNIIYNNEELRQRFYYNGISFWPLVESKVSFTIHKKFKSSIRVILNRYQILKKGKFKVVLLGNDAQDRLRATTILCSKLKIPSLVIQHGIRNGGVFQSYSTKLAVWGNIAKTFLINKGMDSRKIEITGSPRYDLYINLNQNIDLKKKIQNLVYKDFDINKSEKLILFASLANNFYTRHNLQRNLSAFENCLKLPLKVIKNMPNTHLIIKQHPADNYLNLSLEMIKMVGIKNVSIIKNYDILKLIIACDCFISEESTTVLEALLLKKPVICLKLKGSSYSTQYFKYQVILKALNEEELHSQINKALNNSSSLKESKDLLKDYLYKIDDLSTKRILYLIGQLLITQ